MLFFKIQGFVYLISFLITKVCMLIVKFQAIQTCINKNKIGGFFSPHSPFPEETNVNSLVILPLYKLIKTWPHSIYYDLISFSLKQKLNHTMGIALKFAFIIYWCLKDILYINVIYIYIRIHICIFLCIDIYICLYIRIYLNILFNGNIKMN